MPPISWPVIFLPWMALINVLYNKEEEEEEEEEEENSRHMYC